jgi:hypothetical protein
MREAFAMRRLLIAGMVLSFLASAGQGANRVSLSSCCQDTIWTGSVFGVKIAIENDVVWKKMSLGFKIWSPDGATWTWNNMGPTGYGTIKKAVTVPAGSRMSPVSTVWDGGFHVWEVKMTGQYPDSILLTGEAVNGGLPTGPEQEMMRLNITVNGAPGRTFCIDSATIDVWGNLAPGDWVFTDDQGNSNPPEIGWTQGGICWPISTIRCSPPVITSTGHIDAFHCAPGSLDVTAFDEGGGPVDWNYQQLSGSGTFSLTAKTGTIATITYTPAPDEMSGTPSVSIDVFNQFFPCGMNRCCEQWKDTIMVQFHSIGDANNDNGINVGDAVYLINYVFKSGPAPVAWKAGDANCDGLVNVGDAVRLINHVFKGAPSPVNACCL